MNTQKKHSVLLLALAALLPISCTRDAITDVTGSDDTQKVPVSLQLTVSPTEQGTAENFQESATKATPGGTITIMDNADGTITEIKNVFVLQFDGTDDDALLSSWSYVENYSPNSDIQLKVTDHPNRIVFLANTFSPSTRFGINELTLGRLKEYSLKTISDGYSVFGREMVNDETYNLYPMFNGDIIVSDVQTGASLACQLKRNIARINVKVKNSTSAGEQLIVKGARVRKVPTTCYNYTNYTASGDAFSGFPTVNFPKTEVIQTIDYDLQPCANGATGTENTFTFYVPFNMRGTLANTEPTAKNSYAPNTATRLEISAVYGSNQYPVTYTFVLGADLTGDCNLRPNTAYSYTFEIKEKGEPTIDPRVEDWGPVDFTPSNVPRANCYILNPPSDATMSRKFMLPVDRVREYWGGGLMTGNIYESNLTNAMINPATVDDAKWTIDVLWSDFVITDDGGDNFNFRLSKSTGTGTETKPMAGKAGFDSYFEAEVKGGVSGNVLVALRRDADAGETTTCDESGRAQVLWSWHLWITDYNPDDVYVKNISPKEFDAEHPENNQYIYMVPGGEVHIYNNDSFKKDLVQKDGTKRNGTNYGRFVMDRNVGMLSNSFDKTYRDTYVFQFGRKDPFPCGTVYRESGYTISRAFDSDFITSKTTAENQGKNVAFTVNYPMVFITSTNIWTSGYEDDTYYIGNLTSMWNDIYCNSTNGRKSLFDPCPSGWKIPDNSTYVISAGINNASVWADRIQGCGIYYYPDKTNRPNDVIAFTVNATRTSHANSLQFHSTHCFLLIYLGKKLMVWRFAASKI